MRRTPFGEITFWNLLHVDDRPRLDAYRSLLGRPSSPDLGTLSVRERRFLRMLVASVVDRVLTKSTSLEEGAAILWEHPQVRAELLALFEVLADRIVHVSEPLATHPNVPLRVHARYSRLEILAAFGVGDGAKVAPWQTGVYWVEAAKADLLAFTLDTSGAERYLLVVTLDKTSGQFSPTTRYRDYAISRDLIHWESQSVTRADSETGLRYRGHARLGSAIMLFARLRSDERAFYFLGPASYVSHESELPMAVTWRLARSLPGDLFVSFAAAVA